tara:strand:+ start:337 stop:1218 length:882 start_codon:yes stop_codon:yes gene_type:complete
MSWRKNRYNKSSSKKLGWLPSWFGGNDFNERLINLVKDFQAAHGLEEDGLVGPMTYRRITTQREVQNETSFESGIICNGEPVSINWKNIRHDFLPSSCYKTYRRERIPSLIITHWDVCLSANSCRRVLEKRGISSHFVIDNDGAIVQLADTNHACWHAGKRRVNNASIGIDFSNAYYLKYQNTYEKKGFGTRPIIKDARCHGVKLKPFLGYYPIQIEAYKALVGALCSHYGIPLAYPQNNDGELITGVHSPVTYGKFKGVACHYHVTRKKIDTAGLQLDNIIKDLKDLRGQII